MKGITKTLLILPKFLALLLANLSSVYANEVNNGDFEKGLNQTEWLLLGNVGIITYDAYRAIGAIEVSPGENYLVSFNGGDRVPNGSVSQTISTIPGQKYVLSFLYGNYTSPGAVSRTQSITVDVLNSSDLTSLASLLVTDSTGTNNLNNVFNSYSLLFTATSSQTKIQFTDNSISQTSSTDGILDNISITPSSQVETAWVKNFGNKGYDLAVDSTGSFVYTLEKHDNGIGTVITKRQTSDGAEVWTRNITGFTESQDIAVDNEGNVYVLGFLYPTSQPVDFDPTDGVFPLISNDSQDCIVVKLNSNGTFGWAKNIGADTPTGITVNSSGVYTTSYIYNNNTGTQSVITKLSPNNGTTLWSTVFENQEDTIGTSERLNKIIGIATDSQGSIYLTGNFLGTVDFDPTEANSSTSSISYSTSTGVGRIENIFIVKLNENIEGSPQLTWVRIAGGGVGPEAKAISVSAQGVAVTGNFGYGVLLSFGVGGSIYFLNPTFGTVIDTATATVKPSIDSIQAYPLPAPLTSNPLDIFVYKLDSNGSLIWQADFEPINSNFNALVRGVSIDNQGNVYTTGYLQGSADFDPNPNITNVLTAISNQQDIFVSKLNSNGTFAWIRGYGGTTSIGEGKSIYVDNNTNVYITGEFLDTVDFNSDLPGGELSTGNALDDNGFILKLFQP